MRYTKPNIKREWKEAERYKVFRQMGFDGWAKLCVNGKPFRFSDFEHVNNVDLDFNGLEKEKKDRFYEAFDNGSIEMPIVAKFGDGEYELVGGNTRIAGLVMHKIDPYVWVIDTTNDSEDFEMNEKKEILKGGLADGKTIQDIARKYDKKGYYHVDDMSKYVQKQLNKGMKVEMEHTDNKEKAREIAMDHLWEDLKYYDKLEKMEKGEQKEMTGAASSGAYSAPLFTTTKKKLSEALDASASGQYDVPFLGTTSKGRKNPLSIGGPETIYKGRAVKDKNFPKWGGPDSVFVKVKEKCKKYPYCNQGDINAIEILKEDEELMAAIKLAAEMYNLPFSDVQKVVINEINKIFI